MTPRERIRAKIAALLAKTVKAGCTEAEAMAAADLASNLMREHGLSASEIHMSEASTSSKIAQATWRTTLANVAAYCTNTAVILLVDRQNGSQLLFMGQEPGPQIAVFLRDISTRAVERELATFKRGTFYRRRRSLATRRKAAADFVDGMAERLGRRLIVTFAPMRDAEVSHAADQALDARFTDVETVKGRVRKTRYADASLAGWRAGADVPLNHGVGGEPATRLLGGVS